MQDPNSKTCPYNTLHNFNYKSYESFQALTIFLVDNE